MATIPPTVGIAIGTSISAPRPLADRLRPAKLADVIGQEHLLAADACVIHSEVESTVGVNGELNDLLRILLRGGVLLDR